MYDKIINFLNQLPNQRIEDGKGQSSYELIVEIQKYKDDNPVPSLDKNFIIDCIISNMHKSPCFKEEIKHNLKSEQHIKLLQNGVETFKEQPSLRNKCTGHNNEICRTCVNYCSVTGSDSEF